MLRGHWSSPLNHGPDLEDSLGCLVWAPSRPDRTLDIELQGTLGAKNAGDSAIFIRVGNFQFKKLTFGGRVDYSEDNSTKIYAYPTTCQVLFTHKHAELDVASDMAWSTFSFFSGYAEAITEITGQESHVKPEVLGEPNLEEDGADPRYRVDFGMQLGVNIAVSTTVESHRLSWAFDQINNIQS